MKELHHITQIEQARVLLNPIRIDILDQLRKPTVVSQVASELQMSAQRVNNHVKELLNVNLIEIVSETAKRHLIEKTYQTVAKTYWLSPRLTRKMGLDKQKLEEQLSLHNLLKMSEELQEDAAALLGRVRKSEVPSIGVSAEIRLRSGDERKKFAQDYLRLMHELLEQYQGTGPTKTKYKAMLVCYPLVKK
jgi:DNA-binding transcriptional ArsR family regulator